MAFGVTDSGFVLKRLSDILEGMTLALGTVEDQLTGETLTPNLLDENDPLIQQVNAFCDSLAEAWEQLQLAVNQYDPLKATGAGLSGTVQLNGIRRRHGTYSTATFALTGTPNAQIPAGQLVGNIADTITFSLPEIIFDGSGDAIVIGTCTVKGAITAATGTLSKILTPQSGWRTVTNSSDAIPGTAEETDTELRARQQLSTMTTASSLVEAVYGALSNLEGVIYCRVYQNLTLTTDGRGIPAKSIAVVIQGGTNADIAETLFVKASTFPMFGTTEVVKYDLQGIAYTMRFIRPTEIPIYVIVEVTVINALIWPADGDDLIKAAILTFADRDGGALGAITGLVPTGWTIGQNVYDSELYIPVNTVGGHRITAIKIGTAPAPTGSSVTIDWDEVAAFSSANITVEVTTP